MIGDATLICATTMRNEAWILRRFLECASVWADYIVLVDDHSTDDSRGIAAQFPKVRLVEFARADELSPYESDRWRARIEAARELDVPGRRVILALDADEILSANYAADLRKIAAAEPGTTVAARWANLLPDFKQCWLPPEPCVFAFVDDGSQLEIEKSLHVPRVPTGPVLELEDTVLLHYKLTATRRVQARHRYYQVWETESGLRGPLSQYRLYHRIERPGSWLEPIRDEWLTAYSDMGIDMRSVQDDPGHFDSMSVKLIAERGADVFRRSDIWSVDWNRVAKKQGLDLADPISDPRGPGTRLAHRWLAATQGSPRSISVKVGERLLRALGW